MQLQLRIYDDTIEVHLTKTAKLVVENPSLEGHRLPCLLSYIRKGQVVHRNRVDLNFDQDRKVFARSCETSSTLRLEKTLLWVSEQVRQAVRDGLKTAPTEVSVREGRLVTPFWAVRI